MVLVHRKYRSVCIVVIFIAIILNINYYKRYDMDTKKALADTAALLQRKADLLTQQESISQELTELEPRITISQKNLLQATCLHPQYKEIYANTDNKYCGWGKYECVICGHTKTQSW